MIVFKLKDKNRQEDFQLDGARPMKVSITRQTMEALVSLLEVELRDGEFEFDCEYQKTCEILEECRKSLEDIHTKPVEWNPIHIREATEEEKSDYGCDCMYEGYLPDEDGLYLVTLKNGTVDSCEFAKDWDGWSTFDGYDDDEVIAWAELPAPYKEDAK